MNILSSSNWPAEKKVSLEEAQELVLQELEPVGECSVSLDMALHRIISRNAYAGENIPPFDRSPLDGYALRAKDTEKASPRSPVRLRVIDAIRTGQVSARKITAKTAIQVMTGSPVPAGADTVIRYEDTVKNAEDIFISEPLQPKSNIIRTGEDVTRGDLIAARGSLVTPAQAALFAALGITEIPVYDLPRVAIINTGDELIPIDGQLVPGKIRNSNGYLLENFCREYHVAAKVIGTAADHPASVMGHIRNGLKCADVVITTGGVSVGEADVVKKALALLGVEQLFWQVKMKPGSPTTVTKLDGKLIFSLSGNPAAVAVMFHLLVLPALKKLKGQERCLPEPISAVTLDGFSKASPARRFLCGKLAVIDGKACVKLCDHQGNSIISSFVKADVLVDIPAGSGPLAPGDQVRIIPAVNRIEDL
ncbi:MAG: molybdopterin molybdotransferase MoeA [Clostridia bacterium]|nr:molybdopterin molybdotransferase MoeA [Clostridia bacterium]